MDPPFEPWIWGVMSGAVYFRCRDGVDSPCQSRSRRTNSTSKANETGRAKRRTEYLNCETTRSSEATWTPGRNVSVLSGGFHRMNKRGIFLMTQGILPPCRRSGKKIVVDSDISSVLTGGQPNFFRELYLNADKMRAGKLPQLHPLILSPQDDGMLPFFGATQTLVATRSSSVCLLAK